MNKYLSIKTAADSLGVLTFTLHQCKKSGKLSQERISGNQRRYDLSNY
jgi:DNA-binding transcriptional MerR regulator